MHCTQSLVAFSFWSLSSSMIGHKRHDRLCAAVRGSHYLEATAVTCSALHVAGLHLFPHPFAVQKTDGQRCMPMFAGSVAAVDEVQLSSELRGQVQRMLTSGLPPQKQQEAANCLLVRHMTDYE